MQSDLTLWQELDPMYDYRLFYPQISIEDQARTRRPLHGHPARRVYQLPVERRTPRNGGRR